MMRVLLLNGSDEIGRRFNGLDAHDGLLSRGIETSLGCFWNRDSSEPWVFNPFEGRALRLLASIVKVGESLSGHQSRFQIWSSRLLKHPRFLEADLVHLQVVHDYWFRLEAILEVAKTKPTLWSWHDLWPLAGHCLSPVGCPRWGSGCGNCPDLRAPLRVARDRTAAEYTRKHALVRELDIDVTVATEWAKRHITPHLAGSNVRVHVLPFGIDTEIFGPRDGETVRDRLGIHAGSLVVMARSTSDPQKGFLPLVRVLEGLSHEYDVTLLTVQEQGLAAKHSNHLKIVELPWVNSSEELAELMAASDVFAMPSTGESFGMMALEAMACGVPVVNVARTATAEVVDCPQLAIDPDALVESLRVVLCWALENPEELRRLGAAARKRAETVYSMDKYLNGLETLYRQTVARHSSSSDRGRPSDY